MTVNAQQRPDVNGNDQGRLHPHSNRVLPCRFEATRRFADGKAGVAG
jgi:hypothetical protein